MVLLVQHLMQLKNNLIIIIHSWNLFAWTIPLIVHFQMVSQILYYLRTTIRQLMLLKKLVLILVVAFDGDFDRCFFFDEAGEFVPGEYLVGLFASIFLAKEPNATIVHDPRVIWNTQDIVLQKGGNAVQSKTGPCLYQTIHA